MSCRPTLIPISLFPAGHQPFPPCWARIAIPLARFSSSYPQIVATHEKLLVGIFLRLVVLIERGQIEYMHVLARLRLARGRRSRVCPWRRLGGGSRGWFWPLRFVKNNHAVVGSVDLPDLCHR